VADCDARAVLGRDRVRGAERDDVLALAQVREHRGVGASEEEHHGD